MVTWTTPIGTVHPHFARVKLVLIRVAAVAALPLALRAEMPLANPGAALSLLHRLVGRDPECAVVQHRFRRLQRHGFSSLAGRLESC